MTAGAQARPWVRLRRASQWIFLALFTALVGFAADELFFETDPFLMAATSLGERVLLEGLVASLLMLAATLALGRFFCGWICPLGTVIDALAAGRKAKNGLDETANRKLRLPKLALWGAILLLAAAGFQWAWTLDPMVMAGRFVSLALIPALGSFTDRLFGLASALPLVGDSVRDLARSLGMPGGRTWFHGAAAPLSVTALFLAVALAALLFPRLWCRSLCPLGAFYALVGRFSPFGRRTHGCTSCRICTLNCRMGAIRDDGGYEKGECIMCMDCVYDCPTGLTRFSFRERPRTAEPPPEPGRGITRAQFIALAAAPALAGLAAGRRAFAAPGGSAAAAPAPIRPPGALPEGRFADRCIRCGNCMAVCPTSVIQPLLLGHGVSRLWTPAMAYDVGWCEYNCNRCGDACPTGAIAELGMPAKQGFVVGLARVDRTVCYPWTTEENCLVCEEQCPVPTKAIKVLRHTVRRGLVLKRPVVDAGLCIGCGACQNKCPASPVKAIRVGPPERGA